MPSIHMAQQQNATRGSRIDTTHTVRRVRELVIRRGVRRATGSRAGAREAYATLSADLSNLGMTLRVARAERWTASVDRELPDYGCGACCGNQHERCAGENQNSGEPCACASRGHVR